MVMLLVIFPVAVALAWPDSSSAFMTYSVQQKIIQNMDGYCGNPDRRRLSLSKETLRQGLRVSDFGNTWEQR